jgi:hypothetical protein
MWRASPDKQSQVIAILEARTSIEASPPPSPAFPTDTIKYPSTSLALLASQFHLWIDSRKS